MPHPFFTIGHSTRPIEEFVALLQQANVRVLADVRTIPRSRTNPQFNSEALRLTLAERQIQYHHIKKLGGLRGKRPGGEDSPNTFWRNESFRNYADYAWSTEFSEGLQELLDLDRIGVCAIMCAEAVWWRCHRRIIADYLTAMGRTVVHIVSASDMTPAALTAAARLLRDGKVIYDQPLT